MARQMAKLLPGCQSSWDLGWGIVSQRTRVTTARWFLECEHVSAFLRIPYEQNLARWSERYAVRQFIQPASGLLCDYLLLWLIASGDHGTAKASLHFTNVGGQHTVFIRETCQAGSQAIFEIGNKFPPTIDGARARDEAWVRRTRQILNNWWRTSLPRLSDPTLSL